MDETKGPFEDFFDSAAQPAAPVAAEAPAEPPRERPKRGPKPGSKRKPRKQPQQVGTASAEMAVQPHTAAEVVGKKRGRKPRADRHVINGGAKVELGRAIEAVAGLSPEEASFVSAAAGHLHKFPAKARSRIVGALNRLFFI